MSQLAVDVRGLEADYGAGPVLRKITLTVAPGEMMALLGPSGCGKTTLLRCIAGLESPTSGSIVIGEQNVTEGRGVPPERRRVGMVFQDGALFPHRTALDNVRYGLAREQRRNDGGRDSLRLVGLESKADRLPGTLSGGEQQRVALARALAPQPGVLLLDEPFSSLDAGLRVELRGEVHRLLKSVGVTTLLVTHDQEEALMFGDRVAVMRDGVFEQVGTPEQVYATPATPWVAQFVGEADLLDAELAGDAATTELGVVPTHPTARGAGTVMVRPEQLAIRSGGDAVVDTVAYFGRDTRYEVLLASGKRVAVRVPGAPEHAIDERVELRFTGGRAQAWPTAA